MICGLSKLEDLLFQQIPTQVEVFQGKAAMAAQKQRHHQADPHGRWRCVQQDQGEDLSHIFWDELGQEADPQVVLRARSTMRTTDPTVVPKFIATANPLGPGSWWIRDYLVTKALPNRIFNCEFFGAQPSVWVKSTLRDNSYLSNPDQYEAELRASCFGDESKIAAEVLGEWGQVTAGFLVQPVVSNMLLVIFRSHGRRTEVFPRDQGEVVLDRRGWGTASPAVVLMYQVQSQ